MAPPDNIGSSGLDKTKEREKRFNGFLSLAREAQTTLPNLIDPSRLQALVDDLGKQIRTSQRCNLRNAGSETGEQLGAAGVALWNMCTHLKRDQNDQPSPVQRKALVYSRVFAFLMVTLPELGSRHELRTLIRYSRLAIRTGRSCVDGGEHEFALLALQRAADYTGKLQNLQEEMPEDTLNICKRLEAEYLVLRMALSLREESFEVAEHMYGKAQSLRHRLDPSTAECLAEVLYEIGQTFFDQKKNSAMAIKWFQRAYDFLDAQVLEQLSRDAVELRLCICQAQINALLATNTPANFHKAESMVAFIESEQGDTILVLMLRLELLLKGPSDVFDSEAYASILQRMVETLEITDSIFKLLMVHVCRLGAKSPSLACRMLNELFATRVLPSGKEEWIERVVVTYTYIATTYRDAPGTQEDIQNLYDSVQGGAARPLGAKAALGILTLLWKKIESNIQHENTEVAQGWCRVALHPVLVQCGPNNAAKVARKLFTCALKRNDVEDAHEVFHSMDEVARTQPMTIYLAYKLAIRHGDHSMASQCIEQLSAVSPKEPKFLYACCLEAQQSGNKACALQALKSLANEYDLRKKSEIHFPALLRVIIRLQINLLNGGDLVDTEREKLVDDLCTVFEGIVKLLEKDPRDGEGAKLFSTAELDWFCKNAYNLGLGHTEAWNIQYVIRMFKVCIAIIPYYPKDIPAQDFGDLTLRGMFCHFMIGIGQIACARAEDKLEIQAQSYLVARRHVKAFDEELEQRRGTLDADSARDLGSKLATLLVLDFEAAVHLRCWDDLPTIVLKMKSSKDLQGLQAMADYILRAENPPAQVLYSTLRRIVNEIWLLERFEIDKLAKYMRCLLQTTLASDVDLPLRVVEEVIHLVREANKTDKPFPSVELEWLIATTFNNGIDLYGNQEDELSRKWIGHAFELAHLHRDGGVLEKQLHDNFTRLHWDSGTNVERA